MYNDKLGYDPASPQNIEAFALKLEDKTFRDVLLEKGNINESSVESYANRFRKGG